MISGDRYIVLGLQGGIGAFKNKLEFLNLSLSTFGITLYFVRQFLFCSLTFNILIFNILMHVNLYN